MASSRKPRSTAVDPFAPPDPPHGTSQRRAAPEPQDPVGAPQPPARQLDLVYPAGPKLRELAGMDAARAWGEATAQDVKDYISGHVRWSDVDPGCVIHGPPGTGKTTFASAFAATCGIPLLATSYASWQRSGEGHQGNITQSIRQDFELARKNAPCVVFIDELDSLPKRGSGGLNAEFYRPIVNALLEELDGTLDREGVIVIGACNDNSDLDPALVRSGRLDQQIQIPLPSPAALPGIFRFHLGHDAAALGDLKRVAAQCAGMSGADITRIVRTARRNARRERSALREAHLNAAIASGAPALSQQELERAAIHEAGHAFLLLRLGLSDELNLSLTRPIGILGQIQRISRKRSCTRTELCAAIVACLAGRAAEEVILGSVSSAAGGDDVCDLAVANRLSFNAVMNQGLSVQQSLLWFGPSESAADLANAAKLRAEAEHVLDTADAFAMRTLRAEQRTVQSVADALVNARGLSDSDLRRLIFDRRPLAILPARGLTPSCEAQTTEAEARR
jgi:cell division protease FtsH